MIALQKDSYRQFVTEGIQEVLDDFSPVRDYAGRMELQFLGFSLEGTPKYDVKECKERDATYSLPLKVKVRLVHTDTGEATVEDVFMGDFPLMTENGKFHHQRRRESRRQPARPQSGRIQRRHHRQGGRAAL